MPLRNVRIVTRCGVKVMTWHRPFHRECPRRQQIRSYRESAMRRRDVVKLSAGAAMLAAPHIAIAQPERTLKFVPFTGTTVLCCARPVDATDLEAEKRIGVQMQLQM
jgi:hypothetical protein